MQLKSDVCVYPTIPVPVALANASAWEKLCDREATPASNYTASTWVKLLNPPTAFSFDEAWLLCQCSEDQWLGWIPDYGEILLHTREFCSLT